MSDWRNLSTLVAGCGSIGRRHARVLASLGVRHIRACDPIAANRDALRAEVPTVALFDSYEAALSESPDAVIICTPTWFHIPMAKQAVTAGCHVFIEKPLSNSLEGVDELGAICRAKQKICGVAFCYRHHLGLLKANEYLDAGRIGRLVSLRGEMGEHLPLARPDYRELTHYECWDLNHVIDLALWYADQPVKRVLAASGIWSDLEMAREDTAEIIIEFEDRCAASIHLDFFRFPTRRRIELVGTTGAILVEFDEWERSVVSLYEDSRGEWQYEEIATDRDAMFRAEDEEFLRAAAGDGTISCSLADGVRALQTVLQARQG